MFRGLYAGEWRRTWESTISGVADQIDKFWVVYPTCSKASSWHMKGAMGIQTARQGMFAKLQTTQGSARMSQSLSLCRLCGGLDLYIHRRQFHCHEQPTRVVEIGHIKIVVVRGSRSAGFAVVDIVRTDVSRDVFEFEANPSLWSHPLLSKESNVPANEEYYLR